MTIRIDREADPAPRFVGWGFDEVLDRFKHGLDLLPLLVLSPFKLF
ncbi:MAG TPA: hypothetical protein VH325_18415 [Bryobacteraceae bacterium]|nr:hypothetical protein [Bryobacteraceae bacterium]